MVPVFNGYARPSTFNYGQLEICIGRPSITNGIIAKKVIDYLKEKNFESSLAKLRRQEAERNHKHSLFEHHPNAFEIVGEETFMQKVNYIHLNPVRAGLVEHPDDYRFSSSRIWHGRAREDEPLLTDHKQIKWRRAA